MVPIWTHTVCAHTEGHIFSWGKSNHKLEATSNDWVIWILETQSCVFEKKIFEWNGWVIWQIYAEGFAELPNCFPNYLLVFTFPLEVYECGTQSFISFLPFDVASVSNFRHSDRCVSVVVIWYVFIWVGELSKCIAQFLLGCFSVDFWELFNNQEAIFIRCVTCKYFLLIWVFCFLSTIFKSLCS